MSGPQLEKTYDEMEPEEFYAEMTTRNKGIITDAEQEKIKNAKVVVGGCGSIGGNIVEPLVRIGVRNFVLCEPDPFDVSNLNRQQCFVQDTNVNKGEAVMRKVKMINPDINIRVETNGISEENVDGLCEWADIIYDGVDVTTKKPLWFKFLLHQHAKKHGKPVISGYDMAGAQLIVTYDYRDPSVKLFDGKIKESEIHDLGPFQFLFKVIPPWYVPYDLVDVIYKFAEGTLGGFPQVVYCADCYGVMGSRQMVDLFNNASVKKYSYLDVHQVNRPLSYRIPLFFKKWIALTKLLIFVKTKGHG